LKPLSNPPAPISDDERRARIAKAQGLMTEQGPKWFTQPSVAIDQPFA